MQERFFGQGPLKELFEFSLYIELEVVLLHGRAKEV